MNAVKVDRLSENGLEEGGGVSRAHLHLKRHARIPARSHGITYLGALLARHEYVPITTYYCSFQKKQTLEAVKL